MGVGDVGIGREEEEKGKKKKKRKPEEWKPPLGDPRAWQAIMFALLVLHSNTVTLAKPSP